MKNTFLPLLGILPSLAFAESNANTHCSSSEIPAALIAQLKNAQTINLNKGQELPAELKTLIVKLGDTPQTRPQVEKSEGFQEIDLGNGNKAFFKIESVEVESTNNVNPPAELKALIEKLGDIPQVKLLDIQSAKPGKKFEKPESFKEVDLGNGSKAFFKVEGFEVKGADDVALPAELKVQLKKMQKEGFQKITPVTPQPKKDSAEETNALLREVLRELKKLNNR